LIRLGALRSYGWASVAAGVLSLTVVLGLAAADALTLERAMGATVLQLTTLGILLTVAVGRRTGFGALVPGGSRRALRLLLGAGVAMHLAWVAMYLNLRIDLFLVSALTDAEETGLYSLATSLAEIMFFAAWTIAHAAARTQTEAEPEVAARYTLEFVRQSWLIVVVLAAAASAAAYPLIVVAYGSEWTSSALPFAILSFAAVAFALEAPVRVLLARVARPAVVVQPAVVGAVANVVLNLLLVPSLGISGAALASVISYWTYALLLLRRFEHATGLPLRTAFRRPGPDDLLVRALAAIRVRVRPAR
ncbi:MAG TPA: polysaccharide biosynthesis C-terminal domain-containing protein, partial [Baekduia sp.]|nr:polysaccharide biosynthesis C-terminal domain-containing protein [Baekduia sp.]